GLVLVDFWAPWCMPCRVVGPIIEELAEEYAGAVKVGKLNVDDNLQTAQVYRVMSIPTVILFKDGQPVEQVVGVARKADYQARIAKYLNGARATAPGRRRSAGRPTAGAAAWAGLARDLRELGDAPRAARRDLPRRALEARRGQQQAVGGAVGGELLQRPARSLGQLEVDQHVRRVGARLEEAELHAVVDHVGRALELGHGRVVGARQRRGGAGREHRERGRDEDGEGSLPRHAAMLRPAGENVPAAHVRRIGRRRSEGEGRSRAPRPGPPPASRR